MDIRQNKPLSRLTIGTAQFGQPYGIANRSGAPDFAEICTLLEDAAAAGINCLDTAVAYGSEEVLGRALTETGLRDSFFVVTKTDHLIPSTLPSREAEQAIRNSVEQSLRRLQADWLPLVLLHRDENPAYLDALCSCREAGLIGRCGVSFLSVARAQNLLAHPGLAGIQVPANVLDGRFHEAIVRAHARGALVFTRSCYLQGLLLLEDSATPAHLQAVTPDRAFFRRMAQQHGMPLPALLLRIMMNLPEVDSVVVGLETRKQLRENLAIFQAPHLPPDLVREAAAFRPQVPEWLLNPAEWSAHQNGNGALPNEAAGPPQPSLKNPVETSSP